MHTSARGFSLLELLVSVGILITISTVVLANHSRFNSSVLLGSLAYDIALSIREAQVYGVSVRNFSSDFQVGYGVRFADANTYIFFADTNANRQYDEDVDSILRTYTIGRGNSVQRFCGVTAVGEEECSDSGNLITHLDILFFRPDPDAIMTSERPGQYSFARVTVGSPAGETRTVEVASTGQISVQNP